MRRLVAWAALAAVVAIAAARAASAPRAASAFGADERTRRALFEAVTRAEPAIRQRAARGFPGDLWSADDDFHNQELRLAEALAFQHGVSVADVLRAVDEGLHAHWPVTGPAPSPTSPPCHPRPVY
jgi:hypothetical protein